ncbi:glycoside hydrolase family 3 N-terminal domain-containing protein [Brachybacterium sp. J153]|uniref:glycoside hydrolase family 3 N-terminal domain-containing protein n=1 Tax=Brachybacterium sp. J153 TaxID=3116488 RepID=UPI002E75A9B3|nr:glycoside hydrolase family 3 N-terminal domain-containing protein [Brachybacterium sp. J153]MEE1618046.1 glycoside hydrolase family 3 N-terminal domain-containing protein [Brachybacterium sp. J153]
MDAVDAGLAAVVLFAENTPDPATAARFARALHDRREDLLLAIDEEGGDVTRLQARTGSSVPSAWALGEIDDPELTRRLGRALGDLLAACDLDLDLAPVLDVSTDPANPVIGTRAFGAEPDLVAAHARAFATGLIDAGIGTCAKHFPGHGATSVDSHTALPRIDLTAAELARDHLAPWRIAPWLDAVMTAHVLVPALGAGPASISPWSRPLLEEAVGGVFRGLVITDALNMAAVAADPGPEEAAVRALEAGADLLCLGSPRGGDAEGMLRRAHDAIRSAREASRLDAEELRRRAASTRERIRSLRTRRRFVPAPPLEAALDRLDRLGAEAAARAVRSRHGHARLDLGPVTVMDLRHGAHRAASSRPPQLVTALRERGIRADVPDWPARLLDPILPADPALPALPADPALAVPGQVLALTRLPRADAEEARALAALLAARPATIVVHTGVPAAAPDHRLLVLAHGGGLPLMRAAVDLLLRGAEEGRIAPSVTPTAP